MEVYELVGFRTGIDRSGVNFIQPKDAFEILSNAFVYRQQILSRKGFSQFGSRLDDNSRVMGIFENVTPAGLAELLVIDKNFLYSYDEGSDSFTQIPFNSANPIGSFNITSNDDYVSGTTYLTASGGQRFVFTGAGMSDVYFYDGTDVKRFTNTTDNPNYQAPASGALTKATRVFWFGERLNFFVPVIGGTTFNQGILFSGIRDSSGNGDKFNVSGSGLISADTFELLKGIAILGDVIVLNFDRSNWTLEKTRDAFNPYFVRRIPSVLGTDAGFSPVQWNYEIKSMGKTGLIKTDGRRTVRFDNKIPFFTTDEIDPENISLTYGGFDRMEGQFLWAYRSLTSNLSSNTQDKVLVYNYEEDTWAINHHRFSVFGQTVAGEGLVWNQIDETQNPSWARWDTTEEVWNKIGITEETQKTLAGDDLGFIYQINTDYDDYFVDISNISQASSAVVTVSESAFQVNDRIIFQNVEGMTEINGLIGTVLSASTTSLTVDIDSTNFTAYNTGGSVSKTIDFFVQSVPFNPFRAEGMRCYISHIEFLINQNGGDVTVEIFSDQETSPFKTAQIIPDTTTIKPFQWITMIVNQEANFLTFSLKRESASTQTIIQSIRIHAEKAEMTS